jgi:hypothetical protein
LSRRAPNADILCGVEIKQTVRKLGPRSIWSLRGRIFALLRVVKLHRLRSSKGIEATREFSHGLQEF